MLLLALMLIVANTLADPYDALNEFELEELLAQVQSSAFASSYSTSGRSGEEEYSDDQELGYSESELQFENIKEFLLKQIDFQKPTQKDRSYMAMLLPMLGMGQAMADGYSFEEAYAQWPSMVVLGREFPVQAREMLCLKIDESLQSTQLVRDLLNQICGSEVSASCDCKIKEKIKKDPKLSAQGNLLIQIGPLARAWNDHACEWVDVAANNTIEEYYACHKEDLRFIVEQKSLVFTLERDISKERC